MGFLNKIFEAVRVNDTLVDHVNDDDIYNVSTRTVGVVENYRVNATVVDHPNDTEFYNTSTQAVNVSAVESDGTGIEIGDSLTPDAASTHDLGSNGSIFQKLWTGALDGDGSPIDIGDLLDRIDISKGSTTTVWRGLAADDAGAEVSVQPTDGVSTSAVTIYTMAAGVGEHGGDMVLVSGDERSSSNRFVEIVQTIRVGNPSVVSTITQGSPAGRTYSRAAGELQLAMASGTYDVSVMAMGVRRDTNATS